MKSEPTFVGDILQKVLIRLSNFDVASYNYS